LPISEKSAGKVANNYEFWYTIINPPTIATGTKESIDPKAGPIKVTFARCRNLMLGGFFNLFSARMVSQKTKIPKMIIKLTKPKSKM
jgi:hypothetical protein